MQGGAGRGTLKTNRSHGTCEQGTEWSGGAPEHASRHATWPRDTCPALPQLITCPAEIDRAEEKLQYRGNVSRGPQRLRPDPDNDPQ